MATFQIRKYRAEDDEAVKEVFTLGTSEHIPASFMHLLKQPLTQMVLMCTFCALMASSKSFMLPILAVILLLAATRQLSAYLCNTYIDTCLRSDLSDISETYLRAKDSCYWVAECDGRVVGTVACLPVMTAPECLELKRLSVLRSHRRMGIAKALVQTVAAFTRERGFTAVFLITSVVVKDAQKLYESLGYEKIREFKPQLIHKITNFSLFEYRLDLQREKKDGAVLK